MNDTLDKVAVITGAGSGLGAATARRFHREGWRLVLGDLRPEGVQALAQELGATALACDVADERQVEALVQAALDRHGRLDCMINNAGILGAIGPIGTTAARDFNRVLEVMVSGVFHGTKHAANAMGDQGGVILNTASLAGVGAWANHSYTAAKHAVVGLTRSSAVELAPRAIRVNALAPGNVVTGMTSSLSGGEQAAYDRALARNPIPYVCTAADIADAFAYLAGPSARGITGQVLVIDSGLDVAVVPPAYHQAPGRFVE